MKVIAVLLFLTMFTGCSTVGDTRGSSGRAALECGAVGAGLAAAICIAAGGNAATCAGAAAGGGLIGAGACYTFAESYEKRREELAGKENDLDARLKYVRGLNADAEKLNQELRTRVSNISKKTDETVAQIARGTISRQEVEKEKQALLKEQKVALQQAELEKAALEDMKRFQAEQLRKVDGDKALHAQLDKEIEKQERLLRETEGIAKAFASQSQRI